MKQKLFLLTGMFLIVGIMSSCDGDSANNDETGANETEQAEASEAKMKGLMEVDLTSYGFPLLAIVPDSTVGPLDIEETAAGEVIVRVGPTYQVKIAEGGDIDLLKSDLEGDLVYKSTMVIDKPGKLIYASEIPESGIKPAYHFYIVKELGGITYEIQNVKDADPFIEEAIDRMVETVEMYKAKPVS